MNKSEWIYCPVCGNKTRDRLREDTVLKNYLLYCPKCMQESLIDAKDLRVTVIKGFGSKAHS
ncbi:conjugal transfer protein [Schaedlerella arabinosiphila]|uniref:Conjugal transfer protein n=1 Tax=Schaedlerella arabinosiphila TaxID=2044587 RepID=A0A9X5C5W9_9FIRM|nr:cysteine-rich KTR domain-containing protein [Schaedlerella arabinosiphila]NDO68610.1 conjugal transfer protein [Schaedlerella arabinosiphila]